jgi:hypothetical protein
VVLVGRLWAGCCWLAGCVSSEVTYTGNTKSPPKPTNCDITVFASTTPDRPWEDLATIEARCHAMTRGRRGGIDELKMQACKLGGDTIPAFKDGVSGEYSIVIATVARFKEGSEATEIAKSGGAPSPAPEATHPATPVDAPTATSCDPPCSPGFRCAAGQCLPLCNPACDPGEVRNKHRTCEPASAAK